MSLNVELFNKLKAFFRANPKALNMKDWERESECGTTGCIAGWACMLSGKETDSEAAHEYLGISYHDGMELFFSGIWPQRLKIKLWRHAPGTPEYAEVVCEVIDEFVAYGTFSRYD